MESTYYRLFLLQVAALFFSMVLGFPATAQIMHVVLVNVHLDNAIVDPLYDEDGYLDPGESLEVTGLCGTATDFVTSLDTVVITTCQGDELSLHILNPDLYRTSPFGQVNIDHWEVNNVNSGSSALITHTVTANVNIDVYLKQAVSEIQRDPVTARWNPDAGRRSGGDLTWGPAWLTAKSQVSDVTSEGYPALLYAGEAYEKQVDLAVKGRGLDFVFSRVHRSGSPDGNLDGDEGESVDNVGFGGQWTHNFDIVVESPNLSSLITPAKVRMGNGTIANFYQKYVVPAVPPQSFKSYRYFYAEGWDGELELEFENPNLTYRLRFGDGVVWTFESFTSTAAQTRRLVSIADRFGNTLSFAYDGSDRLETITDTLGRDYTIAYVSGEDLIESLTEEGGLGRVISYGYNGDDELTTVTYPATSAFPNPDEPTITYVYDGDNRLATVTDPRGIDILTNGYTDGVLTSQQHGEGAESATLSYLYTGLTLAGGEDHGVRVTDGAGHVTEHFFNEMNQLLRLVRLEDNDEVFTTTSIEWASHTFESSLMGAIDFTVSDDQPASITLPDGIVVTYDYAGPGTSEADYKFRMNAMQITRTGTDGKMLVEAFGHGGVGGGVDYWDARFGERFATCHTLRDADGALLSATAYTYSSDGLATLDGIDYYGIAPYGGDPFAACPPSGSGSLMMLSSLESSVLEEVLESEAMYTSMFEQFEAASELYEFDSFAVESELEMMLTAEASEDHHDSFGYNEFGQVIEHLNPDNDEDGDPGDKERRRDVFVYDDDADGYLDRLVTDADNEALTTTYTQDAVGRVRHVFDPRNNETIIDYDELDQVLQVQQPEIDTVTDYRPTTDYEYDENGNLVLSRHRWTDKDGAAISTAGETNASSYLAVEFAYDSRNRLTSVGRENGTDMTVSELQYDGNGNVLRQLSPLAVDNTESDNVVSYEYDVRDLPVRILRGNELVTRIDYDLGGRVVRTIEGYGTAEARLTSTDYDGLGYLKSTMDAAGLTIVYTSDALGRATRVEAKNGGTVLARTDYTFNVLGRLANINVLHKDQYGSNVGDGWLRTVLDYTDAGMLLSETVENDATTFAYDTVMRLESTTSPGGNSRDFAYDENGNVANVTEHAYDTEAETVTASFITRFGYDELDRVISLGHDDGDGSSSDAKTTRYAYDSLGQLVEQLDALGNITASTYDALGRLEFTTRDPGGIAAVVTYDYDANGRIELVTDPNGHDTAYGYDQLNRLIRTEYADGQVERFTYDALDNVVEHIAPGGLATSTVYDAAGRAIAQTFSALAGRINPGDSAYRYDVLGRLTEARNAGSTVTRAYDTLGHAASESIQVGAHTPSVMERTYDNKGMLASLNPPGISNTLTYPRNSDGLATGVLRNGGQLAILDYLGARPIARDLMNGASPVGGTAIGYEETGLRPDVFAHTNGASATVDTRTFAWDDAYNLGGYQVTGGPLAASTVALDYDALNRIDPASISAGWTLDDAGNRTGGDFTLSGQDALMHRYTEANGVPHLHDPLGSRVAEIVDTESVLFYQYDAKHRLAAFQNITPATGAAFNPLNIGDWDQISGEWEVNDNGTSGDPSDDYLEEVSNPDEIGAVLYTSTPMPEYGYTFRYRSTHNPENPDGDGSPGEFDGDDHTAKFYAQALLSVDTSGGAPYPYAALRIEPDRLSIVLSAGGSIEEIASAAVESAANTWYTVKFWHVAGGPDDGRISVVRYSDTPGDAITLVLNVPRDNPPPPQPIGFTVGEEADYHFQLVEYATAPDTSEAFIDWEYDAFGRKVAETVYDDTNTITSQTLYVWDGWRLVSEVDGVTGTIVAEYTPGPGYVDDTIAVRRDLNRDGDFGDANEGFLYYLTDQQHSTVALLDAAGDVVERYGYDAFGAPSFFDDAGTPIAASAIGNHRLYTGRDYLPTLGLYDYRQRLYDPTAGRFLTTDPIGTYGDPANLGNPYTYVGNNPGAFVDPYGDVVETVWDAASLGIGTVSFGYNVSQGNYLSAGVDALGVALDSVAAAVPILPGGAGIAIRTYRGADIAFNGAQAVASGIDAGIAVSEGDYTGAAITAVGAGLQGAHAGVRLGQSRAAAPLAGVESDVLARMRAGREFDTARAGAYPYREVVLEGTSGKRYRLDSYNEELGEIVSRKYTQLSGVTESTAMEYIRELPRKYPRGAVIDDVPSNRAAGIAGKELQGQYFLEVPVQQAPIPQRVLDYATRHDVFVRDIQGKVYK